MDILWKNIKHYLIGILLQIGILNQHFLGPIIQLKLNH